MAQCLLEAQDFFIAGLKGVLFYQNSSIRFRHVQNHHDASSQGLAPTQIANLG
jgi:hypothetical protein